jgi:hypothetical protein
MHRLGVTLAIENRARASCGKVDPVFRSDDALIQRESIEGIPKMQIHLWVRCFRGHGPAAAAPAAELSLETTLPPSLAEAEMRRCC